ncbi:hypothetical protein DMI66_09240 [Escherichia coli]|nr:hypothetical protein [Escherichia coli]
MRPDFGISPDGGIHFTEMKTRTRKEGLKRRNKEEYEMDRLTRANASKIRAMKQFYWHLPEKIRFSTAKTAFTAR